MKIAWRVYYTPKVFGHHPDAIVSTPKAFLGFVQSDAASRALEAGALAFPRDLATLSVVADVTWRFLSDFERSVFLGTFQAPEERVTVAGVKLCKVCGKVVPRPVDAFGKRRTGRGAEYHEWCATARVKRRRNHRALTLARREALAMGRVA